MNQFAWKIIIIAKKQMEHISINNQYTIEDILNNYQNNKNDNLGQIPSISKLLQDQRLQPYFCHIEKYVNYTNIIFVKKYQLLRSGLYILLSGHISFMSYQNNVKKGKHIRKQTDHNVKVGSSSINIQEQFSIFQSNQQNCVAFQDSYLLYVKEQQALLCKFYEFFQMRMDLLNNFYVSKDHYTFIDKHQIYNLMNFNAKIHSNFRFRTYNFRQNITLNNTGIVCHGRAKLKINDHKGYEFDKYGVMFPDLSYQATSSQIKIMILINNQPQVMKKNDIFNFKMHHNRGSYPRKLHGTFQSSINNSFTFSKDKKNSQKQNFSKGKDMEKIAKQSENYSIISSVLYKKKLQYAKSQNLIKNTKDKKQKRYKSPLVLFQIVNNKSKLAIPNFCDTPSNPSFPTSRQVSKYIHSQHKTNYVMDQKTAFLHKIKLSTKQYARLQEKFNEKINKQRFPEKKKIVFPNSPEKFTMKQLQIQNLQENFIRYAENQRKYDQ